MTTSWISRRKMMQFTVAAAMEAAMKNTRLFAAEPAEDPMRKMFGQKLAFTDLGDGIQLVANAGGNIVMSKGADGILVIDSGVNLRGKDLVAAAEQIAPGAKRKILFNTHWHFDHTGGNADFAEAGYVIAGSAACRKRLGETILLEDMGMTVNPLPEGSRPTVTFEETMDLYQGAPAHVVKFAPAHTDTDSVVIFAKSGVLHTGDLLFNGAFPVIDRSTGGSLDGMMAASKRLLEMTDDKMKVVPGHGPLGDKTSIAAQLEMMQLTRDRLAPLGEKKMTMDEVLTKAPLADLDDKWGRGFLRSPTYTRMAYGQWVTAK